MLKENMIKNGTQERPEAVQVVTEILGKILRVAHLISQYEILLVELLSLKKGPKQFR